MEQVKSPCIGICACNEDDICIGCGRTKNEVANWIYLTEEHKKEIIKKCKERLVQIRV